MIEISRLTKRYGTQTVLHEVDLTIESGSSVALWGPNGAGKTTVVLCMLGLLSYEGSITVDGHDARREGKAVRARVGYVPQQPGFYDDLTVWETLSLSASLRHIGDDRWRSATELVGLESQVDKKVGALSGGMKQRLALAVALLDDPPILLLDEPTANLDAAAREATVRLLEDIRGRGRSLVITSHHLEEVAMLVDRVVIMSEGHIVDECPPGELADRLGLRSWLHLVLEPRDVQSAGDVLGRLGFDARRNGQGLLVELLPEDKGSAIAALDRAGVRILDVEVWR